jgi:hypothetical protein
MSAYVVDDKTISALAKAIIDYGVDFKAEGFTMPSICGVIFDDGEMKQAVGDRLLEANYDSVNYRYNEDDTPREYKYEDVEINEGIVLGCLNCFDYQACEVDGWEESELYGSLMALKDELLTRLIKRAGYKVPWGYDGHDTFASTRY